MNNVKFRAWNKENKSMIEWNDSFFSDMSEVTRFSSYWSYIDKPLMEYTNLKDINGVDIYEGDIISIDSRLLVVYKGIHTYDSRDALIGGMERLVSGYYLESECGNWKLNIMVEIDKLKVIGNIYEHYYLLK